MSTAKSATLDFLLQPGAQSSLHKVDQRGGSWLHVDARLEGLVLGVCLNPYKGQPWGSVHDRSDFHLGPTVMTKPFSNTFESDISAERGTSSPVPDRQVGMKKKECMGQISSNF